VGISVVHGTPASSSAAGTTLAFQPGLTASPGDILLVVIAQDNGGTNGAQSMSAPTLINGTAGKGTVTSRRTQNYDPGAADAGITQGIYEILVTAPWTASDWVQCNSSASDRISAHVVRLRPDPGFALAFGTAGGTSGASSAAPTTTTGSITSGDVVVAAYAGATNESVTADADSSNGSWSSQSSSSSDSGTLATSTTVACQSKITTGTATQTYDVTTSSAASCIVGYVSYTQAAAGRSATAWRWYADGVGLGAALAAENTVPTLTAAQNKNIPLRLRVTLRSSTNKTESLTVQMKTDWGGTWTNIAASGATTKDWARYANGADTAGNTVTAVLTGADTNGVYVEAGSSSQTVNSADNDKEFDFSISLRYPPPATRVYFRINGTGVWDALGLDCIAVDTPAESTWQDNSGTASVVSKTFGPNTGADAKNFEAYRHKVIYDGTYWWLFYAKETTVGGADTRDRIYYRYFDGSAWSSESSLTLTTAITSLKMYGPSVQFGNNAGTKYVFLAYQSASTVTRLYRGTISGTSISWSGETSLTTSQDSTSQGNLTISADGYLFLHGLSTSVTTQIWRCVRSTNAYDISAWGTVTEGGGAGARAAAAQADHTQGVSLGNNSVLVFGIDSNNSSAGTLYCRPISGSGGSISYDGSTVTVNATANCHPTDWSAFRNSDGDIFCAHSDGAAASDTGALVLRVSQDGGATWTTCTSPSVTMDGTSVDGVWIADDGARGLYIFYTGAESGSGGNTTELRYKHYTVTGGAVTTGTWGSATVMFGTGMGNGDAIYAANVGGGRILAFNERGDDDNTGTLEFWINWGQIILSQAVTGTSAQTQADQTSSASGAETFTGTSAQTQADQTSTASGVVANPVTGTSAQTQADQTSAASGSETFTGTSAQTQADQTSSGAGIVANPVTGTSAQTQADQTSSASGSETFTGTSAQTQADQTSSASGAETFTGTSAQTQADQTSTASGVVANPVTGTSAQTQADQTSSAAGAETFTGTVAQTQESQTSTASGTVHTGVTGTAAVTQADQTSSASGAETFTGTSAQTQESQTSTASGTVANPVTGTSAQTQADQTSSASGAETFTGTSGQTQAAQTSSASGTVNYTGTSGQTQADQTSAAIGSVTITGPASPTQSAQTSTATGIVANPVTGSAAVTQADHTTSSATGIIGDTLTRSGRATTAHDPCTVDVHDPDSVTAYDAHSIESIDPRTPVRDNDTLGVHP
jgi:hypothetical protein